MPELPEVERARRLAEGVAVGRRIDSVEIAPDEIVFERVPPARVRRALLGKEVHAASRRGKQLWLRLEAPPHPLFHFGMSGGFHLRGVAPLQLKAGPREGDDEAAWPPRFWKIKLRFSDGGELIMTDARRLGRILLREDPLGEPPISRLGFDVFLDLPAPRRFAELLRGRDAAIKSLLLDQRFSAGVGNWIADEVLYQAGIDPRRPASSLGGTEARALREKLRSVVARGVAALAAGREYPASWLFHRRWGKRPDARTARGEPVEHLRIGGRTTAWVPSAQR